MLNNRGDTNKSPRAQRDTVTPGHHSQYANNNSTTALGESKSRYQKGMEIYRAGRVQLTPSGIFKVSERFYVDTEKMQCDCPDYKARKESCKHIFAACLFVKNRGKQVIEDLPGTGNTDVTALDKPVESQNTPTEARSKDFDKQAVITRLATINSAIEVLKTHRKPIEYGDIVSLAVQLEKWALGGGNV